MSRVLWGKKKTGRNVVITGQSRGGKKKKGGKNRSTNITPKRLKRGRQEAHMESVKKRLTHSPLKSSETAWGRARKNKE